MAYYVRDLIAPKPVTLSAASTLVDAAMAMRDFDVGAIVVLANNQHIWDRNRPRYRRSRHR